MLEMIEHVRCYEIEYRSEEEEEGKLPRSNEG